MFGIFQFLKRVFLNRQQIAHFLISLCLIAERIEQCTVEKVFTTSQNIYRNIDKIYCDHLVPLYPFFVNFIT